MVSFLLLKDYSTSNLHIRTSIIILGCKDLSLKKLFFCSSYWNLWHELRYLRRALALRKTNQKPRTNSSLQVETKDTSLGAHIHDGQSLEPFYPAFESCQKHSPKLDLGLLRIYSLQATRCHRSTPYTLSTTSMTSEGEHIILTSFGLLTGTPFKSESGLLRIYSLRYLYP